MQHIPALLDPTISALVQHVSRVWPPCYEGVGQPLEGGLRLKIWRGREDRDVGLGDVGRDDLGTWQRHDILDFSSCPLSRVLHATLANWQEFGFEFHLRSSAFSEYMDISRPADYFIACYTVLMRPKRSKQLSTVAIVGFQFGLYHVVAPLSFLRSINLALFVTFYFWLIRSLTDPAFTGSIFVCGPLHHHACSF